MGFLNKNKIKKLTIEERKKLLDIIDTNLSDSELQKLAKAIQIPFVKKMAVEKLNEFI